MAEQADLDSGIRTQVPPLSPCAKSGISPPSLAQTGSGKNSTARHKPSLGLSFWLPLGWILLVCAGALSAPWWPLPGFDAIDWNHPSARPGTIHLLGTDGMGRDILARLLFGARVSLMVGLLAPLIGLFLGGGSGLLAGYYRGRVAALLGGVMDAILAFPALVLLLTIVYLCGASLLTITLSLGCLSVPAFFRVARANTLKYVDLEFVLAARASGQTDLDIILREILPNTLFPLSIYALLVVGYMIIIEGGLGFLGLSVPTPTPSWGGMVADGQGVLRAAPHVCLIPMTAMFLTILAFNLLGDRLRRLADRRESHL